MLLNQFFILTYYSFFFITKDRLYKLELILVDKFYLIIEPLVQIIIKYIYV